MKIPHPEAKAINLFNEALANLSTCDFPDLKSRKEKAKANCFLLITNIKIALYEATELDKVPSRAYQETEKYYAQVRTIITLF
jgi:hypothetical protein